ncbi:hypothetical protein BH24ACT14_BH24ACT14_18140 [soil metagenome]
MSARALGKQLGGLDLTVDVADGALRRCVGDVDRFLAQDWTRRPHVHRGDGFDDLLSLDDVDYILATMALRAPAFRLVKAGQPLAQPTYTRPARIGSRPVADLIDVGKVHAAFDDGATIVLQGLHRYWAPLTAFCRDLEATLTQPVQANAYITPPVSSGLRVHHDGHDVFALQTYGRKQWVAYEPGIDEQQPPATPLMDLQLQAGEALYMPRGAPHAARTVDAASVHITIGIRSTTWAELLRRVVTDIIDEAEFDDVLPTSYAHDPQTLAPAVAARLDDLASRITARDAGAVATAAADRFWSSRPPQLSGQLRQLLAADQIDDATEVVRRPGATCRLMSTDGRLTAQLGDRRLRMPVSLAPAMTFVAAHRDFAVNDLAGLLNEASRTVLVRRLVREGLLMVAQ